MAEVSGGKAPGSAKRDGKLPLDKRKLQRLNTETGVTEMVPSLVSKDVATS